MLNVCVCAHMHMHTHTNTVNLGDGGLFHLKNSKNTKCIIKFLTAIKERKKAAGTGRKMVTWLEVGKLAKELKFKKV